MILAAMRAVLLCLLLAMPALAQTTVQSPVTEEWTQLATRAEAAIDSDQASITAFEELRAELVEYRAVFLAAQSVNSARIETVAAQIAALPDPPAEGETEPAEIATARSELTEQLETLTTPRRTAETAYTRADGLIREIDRIVRERQAEELITLSPSPMVPSNWIAAGAHILTSLRGIQGETLMTWRSDARRAEFQRNLPIVLFYFAVGMLLLLRGRVWIEKVSLSMLENASRRRTVALSTLLSMGQVILPVLGLAALIEAVQASGFVGVRGDVVLETVPMMGLAIFGGYWLAGRSFPKGSRSDKPLNLRESRQRMGRFTAACLAIIYALSLLLQQLAVSGGYPMAAQSVTQFPLILLGGFFLFRIGHLLRQHLSNEQAGDGASSYRDRLIDLTGRAAKVIAIVAPIAAAIGYRAAADALLYPAILTLALFSGVSTLQRLVNDLYDAFVGARTGATPAEEGESAREPLFPVLAGFLLAIGSLPILALIWGARTSDLTELWAQFLAGFDLGGTKISPANILTFAIVFGIGYLLTRAFQGALRSSILPRTALDAGGRNAVTSGVGYVGIFVAALIAIGAAGLDLSGLAIVAGALSVGIGFGLQTIVSNFVSGIILLIERPISEGDWIEVGDKMGIVQSISVRSTRIQTFDKRDVIVPNSDFISGTVTNWTRGNLTGRVTVSVGVAYGTDTRKVEAILREICEDHPLVSVDPPPGIHFRRFGADALEFECYCVLKNVNYLMAVNTEINHAIAKRFGEEGIEIPYSQRDIWLRNPEALASTPPLATTPAPSAAREEPHLGDVAMGEDGDGDGDGEGDR